MIRLMMPALVLALACCAAQTAPSAVGGDPGVVTPAAATGDPASPEALGWTPEQHATARRYARERWTFWFLQTLGGILALAVLVMTGVAGRLEDRLPRRIPPGWRRDAIVAAAIILLLQALQLPLDVARHQREVAYGFATQTFGAWLFDRIKMGGVEIALALIALVPLFAMTRRFPRRWWIAGATGVIVLTTVVAAVAPVFIAPLFNSFHPLPEGPLREEIMMMARDHGIPDADVLQVDASRQSRHDNAYVAGLLGTERIVLYDTLIEAYTTDETLFVLGHEIAHYRLSHIWKGVAVFALAISAGFWLLDRLLPWMARVAGRRARLVGPDTRGVRRTMAALPLVLLYFSVCGLLMQPVGSAFSRHLEHEADLYALRAVSSTPGWRAAAVSSFQKMAARNLSDPDPPAWIEWFLYSHPSAGRRIRLCATWEPSAP